MIHRDLTATIGKTPLVELARMAKGLPGRVVAKLEMQNPCGSVKDRLGVALIEDAERRGALRAGMTIIEATGGNTGIGLALAAPIRGYRLPVHRKSTRRLTGIRDSEFLDMFPFAQIFLRFDASRILLGHAHTMNAERHAPTVGTRPGDFAK